MPTIIRIAPVATPSPKAPALLPQITASARRILGWPFRVIAARRAMAQFAAMTEGQLNDIGLTRGDVSNVSALSVDQDPSAALAQVVAERRRYRRRAP